MSTFSHAKRGAMTPQRALKIFERCGGKCSSDRCGHRKLLVGDDWAVDHIIALENGGTDDDDNLQVLCEWCHSAKTSDDNGLAGHGRRMATKHKVPRRFKQSRGWR